MTRSPRRRTIVVLTALAACLAGLALAVVAFGQSTSDYYDTTVPTGNYTATTPAKTTTSTPTSQYTVTTPATTVPSGAAGVPAGGGTTPRVPSRAHRTPSTTHTSTTPHVSKATRPGPARLAFTGGEPLIVGGFGAALMLAAAALQLRRRRSTGSRAA